MPAFPVLAVALTLVHDAEELVSLNARLRALLAIAGADRESRDQVREVALPRLMARYVSAKEVERHRARPRPTVEWMCPEDDRALATLFADACSVRPTTYVYALEPRRAHVDFLAWLAEQRALWPLLPLKRLARTLKEETITARTARDTLCLSNDQAAGCRVSRGRLSKDAAIRAALLAFGGTRALLLCIQGRETRAARRALLASQRAERAAKVRLESGDPAAWDWIAGSFVDLAELARVFVKKGGDARMWDALFLYRERRDEIALRRADVLANELALWPGEDQVAEWTTVVPHRARLSFDTYCLYGCELDLKEARDFHQRWSRVASAWAYLVAGEPPNAQTIPCPCWAPIGQPLSRYLSGKLQPTEPSWVLGLLSRWMQECKIVGRL